MQSRARLAVSVAVVCAVLFSGLRSVEPPVYTLHTASQPLDSALQEFARQTGVQIVFFSHLADGKRAPALDGTYTIDSAMNALLANSKLTYRWVNAQTIEITPLRRGTDGNN